MIQRKETFSHLINALARSGQHEITRRVKCKYGDRVDDFKEKKSKKTVQPTDRRLPLKIYTIFLKHSYPKKINVSSVDS